MEAIESYAPGRAEVLGNHTDYNEGLVLAIAINCGTRVLAEKTDDPTLDLFAKDLDQRYSAPLDDLKPTDTESWPNYMLGVAKELQQRNVALSGTKLTVSSTVPIGGGLSSSAAMEMSTALAFRKLYPYDLPDLEIAKVGQAAEHHFAGVHCGLLDQIASLMSKKDHATYIDFRTLQIDHLPLSADYRFVLIHSGVSHALVAGEYNERRASCEQAAKALGQSALRDVTPEGLEAGKNDLSEKAYKRAYHVVHENNRVAQAKEFLLSGNMQGFGALMSESHLSSRDFFENSCPELDFLVETAQAEESCLGARLCGGGFGGGTINLVETSQAETFAQSMKARYLEKYGREAKILITDACDGAR